MCKCLHDSTNVFQPRSHCALLQSARRPPVTGQLEPHEGTSPGAAVAVQCRGFLAVHVGVKSVDVNYARLLAFYAMVGQSSALWSI